MRDKLSGRSRGFGFVSFVNKDAVDLATQQEHVLDGRNVCSRQIATNEMQAALFLREINRGFVPPPPPPFHKDLLYYFITLRIKQQFIDD